MSGLTYEQAFADWSYLWKTYGPANDMTGAYVDQHDLAKLLRSPTKATARECLCAQIGHWFSVGPDDSGAGRPADHSDQKLHDIAERHGIVWP